MTQERRKFGVAERRPPSTGTQNDIASYSPPSFLTPYFSPTAYRKWLNKTAAAHVRRDRDRDNTVVTRAIYKRAIHDALEECKGLDDYTCKSLDWSLLGKYDNVKSQEQRRKYKHALANKPTIDHVNDGTGLPVLKICSWRVNDAKHDLPYAEFVELCREVIGGFEASLVNGGLA